jgi:PAS domain S-box-containing protein
MKATKMMESGDSRHPIMIDKDKLKDLGESINVAMNKSKELDTFSVHSVGKEEMTLLRLKKSRDEWVNTFDAITDITTIHDEEFRIVRANKAFLEKFNVDKKQLNGEKYYELFYDTDKPGSHCMLEKCKKSLKPECEEVDDPNMGGIFLISTYPLLDEKGVFYGAIQQVRDITERKKTEEEIRKAKEFSENLVETAHDAIVCIDEDGRVIVWNHSAEKIFGYSRSEIMGQPITTIIPERYRKKHLEGLKRFIQTDQTKIIGKKIEASGKTKEGKEIPIELSLSFQKTVNDRYSFMGIIRDITFEKEAKRQLIEKSNELEYYSRTLEQKVEGRTRELKKANIKLKEQDNMKTEFLSIVSHELRTPLALVLGFAGIIDKRFKDVISPHVKTDDDKVQRSLSEVQQDLGTIILEGKRLTRLIDELLDITKIEAGKIEWNMESISMDEIIKQPIAVTRSSFKQNKLEMIEDIEGALPLVIGDKDRLKQVVINLISNAIKFTDRGSVTCSARKLENEIMISVIDTGIGIAETNQGKVFEKFKQAGDNHTGRSNGTGLGLSICKQIVEHHGGRIWVESKPGEGSNFSFTLPISLSPEITRRNGGSNGYGVNSREISVL